MAVSSVKAQPTWTPPNFDLPELAYPDHSTIPEEARIVPLQHNQRAPFHGVLWNHAANAWTIADYHAIQRIWIAEMQLRLDLTRAWAIYELESLWNSNEAENQLFSVQMESKNDTIEDLNQINQELALQVGFTRREKFITVTVTITTALVAGLLGYGIAIALR